MCGGINEQVSSVEVPVKNIDLWAPVPKNDPDTDNGESKPVIEPPAEQGTAPKEAIDTAPASC